MINKKMLELGSNGSTIRELFEYGKRLAAEKGEDSVFDFSIGNPSIPAPTEVNEELIKIISDTPPVALHGYTCAEGDTKARRAIALDIKRRFDFPANEENIYLTAGASAALISAIKALVNPGEKIIFFAPYFPEYKIFAESCGAECIAIPCREDDFAPDVKLLDSVIDENCAAIIVNSPNNPTGAIYSEQVIKDLSATLKKHSQKNGKPIYIISDEPYRDLVYDGIKIPFIPKYYKNTIVCYSYSKALSLPGERIGYVFVPHSCDDNETVYKTIAGAARSCGYICAPSLLQHLIGRVCALNTDISAYDRCRKLLTDALSKYGFSFADPNGAFYLFLKAPGGDGRKFSDIAKTLGLLFVPSEDFGYKGYVRIAYCQSEQMIRRSLPQFRTLAMMTQDKGDNSAKL